MGITKEFLINELTNNIKKNLLDRMEIECDMEFQDDVIEKIDLGCEKIKDINQNLLSTDIGSVMMDEFVELINKLEKKNKFIASLVNNDIEDSLNNIYYTGKNYSPLIIYDNNKSFKDNRLNNYEYEAEHKDIGAESNVLRFIRNQILFKTFLINPIETICISDDFFDFFKNITKENNQNESEIFKFDVVGSENKVDLFSRVINNKYSSDEELLIFIEEISKMLIYTEFKGSQFINYKFDSKFKELIEDKIDYLIKKNLENIDIFKLIKRNSLFCLNDMGEINDKIIKRYEKEILEVIKRFNIEVYSPLEFSVINNLFEKEGFNCFPFDFKEQNNNYELAINQNHLNWLLLDYYNETKIPLGLIFSDVFINSNNLKINKIIDKDKSKNQYIEKIVFVFDKNLFNDLTKEKAINLISKKIKDILKEENLEKDINLVYQVNDKDVMSNYLVKMICAEYRENLLLESIELKSNQIIKVKL